MKQIVHRLVQRALGQRVGHEIVGAEAQKLMQHHRAEFFRDQDHLDLVGLGRLDQFPDQGQMGVVFESDLFETVFISIDERGPTGTAAAMLRDPRAAYLVLGCEPELDCADGRAALSALRQAKTVIALTSFVSPLMREYADALLPIAPFTETSGSFVNTEGRLQSFEAVCRPAGEARPGWKVLRVLGNLLQLAGFEQSSSEDVRAELVADEPEFVGGLDNTVAEGALGAVPAAAAAAALQRISDVPIYFADPLARRSPVLQATLDAALPTARVSRATLDRLGLASASAVRLKQGEGEAVLDIAIDEGVPEGCVRIAAGHAATAGLGALFGRLVMERI